ncbi:MAG: DNA primase, partial [Pseudomonadota bacterium]|nr:DNA primase [Pseudomonadota bacterium]
MSVAEELAKLQATRGLDAEIEEAAEELGASDDDTLTRRLHQATETRNRALRSEQEDRAHYDVGENGARINRDERDAFDAILGKINFSRR